MAQGTLAETEAALADTQGVVVEVVPTQGTLKSVVTQGTLMSPTHGTESVDDDDDDVEAWALA